MKYTKDTIKAYVTSVRENLQWIDGEDQDEAIAIVNTFDAKLAGHLQTVQGAARDALTYMNERGN